MTVAGSHIQYNTGATVPVFGLPHRLVKQIPDNCDLYDTGNIDECRRFTVSLVCTQSV
jgi:hypothetical protein